MVKHFDKLNARCRYKKAARFIVSADFIGSRLAEQKICGNAACSFASLLCGKTSTSTYLFIYLLTILVLKNKFEPAV